MTGLVLKLIYFTPNKQEEIQKWLVKQAEQSRQKKSFADSPVKKHTINNELFREQFQSSYQDTQQKKLVYSGESTNLEIKNTNHIGSVSHPHTKSVNS